MDRNKIVADLDEQGLKALIEAARVDNWKLYHAIQTNCELTSLAELRLLNLAIEAAEVE
jgi:hypothetical protein